MIQRLVYWSRVDLDRDNGPGINEREFIRAAARRLGGGFLVLSPTQFAGPTLQEARSLGVQVANCDPVREPLRSLKRIKAHEPEILVSRIHPAPLDIYGLAKSSRIPLALKTVGLGSLTRGRVGTMQERLVARALQDFAAPAVRVAVAVDSCTPEIATHLENRYSLRQRLRVIPNAVDVARFSPGPRDPELRERLDLGDRSPVIGVASARIVQRGGNLLLSLADRLLREYPDAVMLVIGDGQGREVLADDVRIRGMGQSVRLVGHIPFNDLPRYIRLFDVALAHDDPAHQALVGNSSQKVRQFVASGVPVVADTVGNEFLESEGLGVRVDFAESGRVIEAIKKCLSLTLHAPSPSTFATRAARFARRELSTKIALELRLTFWTEQLETLRRRNDTARRRA